MSIRPFTSDDLAACVDLYIRVYAQPPWHEDWPHAAALAHFEQSSGTPGFYGWVAVEAGELIGVLTGYMKPALSGSIFFMEDLFVAVAHQRQGQATKLMVAVKKWVERQHGLGIALLTMRHAPALAYYRQQDFTEHHELAYLMWLPPEKPAKQQVSKPRRAGARGQ